MSRRNYHFQSRGIGAVRVWYEGEDLGVLDRSGLWDEYKKVSFPGGDDSAKRYVIERAIEYLEGKAPQSPRRAPGGRVEWVSRWEQVTTPRRKRKTVFARIRGLFRDLLRR